MHTLGLPRSAQCTARAPHCDWSSLAPHAPANLQPGTRPCGLPFCSPILCHQTSGLTYHALIATTHPSSLGRHYPLACLIPCSSRCSAPLDFLSCTSPELAWYRPVPFRYIALRFFPLESALVSPHGSSLSPDLSVPSGYIARRIPPPRIALGTCRTHDRMSSASLASVSPFHLLPASRIGPRFMPSTMKFPRATIPSLPHLPASYIPSCGSFVCSSVDPSSRLY